MTRVLQRMILLTGLCLLSLGAGCGKGLETYPVTGTVTIDGDDLLTVGEVIFTSDTVTARGAIHEDGTFTLKTSTERDWPGAPPGKYRVYILGASWYEDPSRLDSPSKLLIDSKFNDYRTSGLEYTVEPEPNAFDIEVTSPKE